MPRRLPSLSALRTFAQAGRFENFAQAAEALFVTPSAVSRLITQLEKELGVPLFTRRGRRVELNPDGRSYLDVVQDAFERIAVATAALQDRGTARRILTVSSLPSFASRWLAPRLADFVRKHPDIDLRITASRHLVNFEREGVHAAIRYGKGDWPGVSAELLFEEEVFPVCSPKLRSDGPPLSEPKDLRHFTLLHGDIREDWRMWLRAAGASSVSPETGPRFSDDGAMLEAAVEGVGVALGRSELVAADLAAGRLVAPFALKVRATYSYWLVRPAGPCPAAVQVLRDWMAEQTASASRRV